MKFLQWPALLLAFTYGHSQSLLNGDFEMNSANECEFNLANSDYTNKMSHSWAFGSGEEVDIQTFVCGYETPPTGSWFVSLSKDTEGNCDAISLELSEKLVPGHIYEISYWSSALMGSTGLQFGLSDTNDSFGMQIFASQPVLNLWQQHTHSFVAPNSGRFITVRTDAASLMGGWNLLDNLQISAMLSNGGHDLATVAIYPNPSQGHFTIEAASSITDVKIYNAIGQLVKSVPVSGLSTASFDLTTDGVYFVKLMSGGRSATKKIVVSQR
jgi:hypothetical protein